MSSTSGPRPAAPCEISAHGNAMPVPISWHGRPRRRPAERPDLVLDESRRTRRCAGCSGGARRRMHEVERLHRPPLVRRSRGARRSRLPVRRCSRRRRSRRPPAAPPRASARRSRARSPCRAATRRGARLTSAPAAAATAAVSSLQLSATTSRRSRGASCARTAPIVAAIPAASSCAGIRTARLGRRAPDSRARHARAPAGRREHLQQQHAGRHEQTTATTVSSSRRRRRGRPCSQAHGGRPS